MSNEIGTWGFVENKGQMPAVYYRISSYKLGEKGHFLRHRIKVCPPILLKLPAVPIQRHKIVLLSRVTSGSLYLVDISLVHFVNSSPRP